MSHHLGIDRERRGRALRRLVLSLLAMLVLTCVPPAAAGVARDF
jgi:hypothetical protein